MTVLVTGGAGYIGSHMILTLLDNSREEVIVIDNLSTGFRSAVDKRAKFIQGDIADEILVSDIIQKNDVDSVIHFAARTVVPDSIERPLDYYFENTVKTRNLIETSIKHGVKNIIFSSTAAVYGDVELDLVDEGHGTSPINPYGRSKLMSEWILSDAARAHKVSYAILRYFNVAGADPLGRAGQSTENATHLIKVAIQAALKLRPHFDLFGDAYPTHDGTCVRDFIHVADLADAHLLALNHLRNGGKNLLLNCGYGTGHSVREVIDTVKDVSGRDFDVRLCPARKGDAAKVVASAAKLHATLGWQPRHLSLETIVSHALNWEIESSKIQNAGFRSGK